MRPIGLTFCCSLFVTMFVQQQELRIKVPAHSSCIPTADLHMLISQLSTLVDIRCFLFSVARFAMAMSRSDNVEPIVHKSLSLNYRAVVKVLLLQQRPGNGPSYSCHRFQSVRVGITSCYLGGTIGRERKRRRSDGDKDWGRGLASPRIGQKDKRLQPKQTGRSGRQATSSHSPSCVLEVLHCPMGATAWASPMARGDGSQLGPIPGRR
jgi:hypothetical protein